MVSVEIVFSNQDQLALLMIGLRENLIQRAPNHQLNQGRSIQLINGTGIDKLAIFQHGHLVGDAKDLVEPVRDVNDGDALLRLATR